MKAKPIFIVLLMGYLIQPVFAQQQDCHVLYVIHLKKCNSLHLSPNSDSCCVSHYFSKIENWDQFIATHDIGKITQMSIENPSEIMEFLDFTRFKKLQYLDLHGNDYDVLNTIPSSFYQIKKLKKLAIRGITLPADLAQKIKIAYPKTAIQLNQRSQFEDAFQDNF